MIAAIVLYRVVCAIVDLLLAGLALVAIGYLIRWALRAALDRITGKRVTPLPRRCLPALPADGEPLTGHEPWVLEGIAEASAGTERETS